MKCEKTFAQCIDDKIRACVPALVAHCRRTLDKRCEKLAETLRGLGKLPLPCKKCEGQKRGNKRAYSVGKLLQESISPSSAVPFSKS